MLIIDILVYLAIYLSCYHYYFISLSFFIHTVNILTIIHILFITIISLHSFLHSSLVHSIHTYTFIYPSYYTLQTLTQYIQSLYTATHIKILILILHNHYHIISLNIFLLITLYT